MRVSAKRRWKPINPSAWIFIFKNTMKVYINVFATRSIEKCHAFTNGGRNKLGNKGQDKCVYLESEILLKRTQKST